MATFTGSYSQPIVMGLTPWQTSRIGRPGQLSGEWPPTLDAERLERYDDYETLVENRPWEVFDRLQISPDQREKIVLALALPELLCNVWADAVWGEQPPSIELPSDAAQTAWDAIDEANEYGEIRAWESVFAAAMRGTSVLRLYRSEEIGAITGSPVVIEEIDAGIFFPKLRKGSDRLLDFVVLAWEENRGAPGDRDEIWQIRQTHAVVNGAYSILTEERQAKGDKAFRRVGPAEITDLDFLPFVDLHAKRWSGRYWGLSELDRSMTFFSDIDDTLSNVAEILEYHGKPMLQVPMSTMFGGVLSKGADRVVGIRNKDEADIARYVTFDGQLDAQLASLDKSVELTMLVQEVPRTYFGLGLDNQGAPSGTALRLQLQNYLKKAGRWGRAEARRSKAVIDMALRVQGGFEKPEARLAKITLGSPLPADEQQDAQIETALHAEGLSSTETSIRRLRRFDSSKEVDEEVQRIDDEKTASVAALPAPLRANAAPANAAGGTNSGGIPDPTASTQGGATAARQS